MGRTECIVVWVKLEVGFHSAKRRPQHVFTLSVIDEQRDIASPIGLAGRRATEGEVKQETHFTTFVVRPVPSVPCVVSRQ
jgi:hypothetical protein